MRPDTSGPRVLVISHDVVGSRMAGPGIRAWEIAKVLSRHQPLSLIAPQPIDLDAPFPCGSYTWGDAHSLAAWLDDADVVVANGYVLQAYPKLADIPQPLALDLYDPVLLENLELFRDKAPDQRRSQIQQDIILLNRQLAAGDFFACATERQRDLYVGALMAAGRVTPAATDHDQTLRSLINVVPFGLQSEAPVKQRPALRGVVPGIGADDLVVLWTGGMWDWLDPQTLVRALPSVVADHPNVRVVFLAGHHPGAIQPMRVPESTRVLARELDLLDRHVFFYEQWIPYHERADFLLEADIAVSLHHDHLETRYAAVRSRFLDHLWAGLPSIASDGDAAAELVRHYDVGVVVAARDDSLVSAGLRQLLSDESYRQRCRAHARSLAKEYTWECVLQPLTSFCRRPYSMREKLEQSETVSSAMPEANLARDRAIASAEELWQVKPQPLTSSLPMVGQLKQSANTLTRWYVETIVEQQNNFNAATVHALHQVAESIDRRYSQTLEEIVNLRHSEMSDLRHTVESISRQIAELQERLDEIDTRVSDIDNVQLAIARMLATPTETED